LGGFINIQQVGETFGLPDSVYQSLVPWLKCDTSAIRKIRLNHVSPDSLRMHPYIDKTMARSLVEFRSRHGPFRQIDDLRKVFWVNEEWLLKIRPYLSLE
jgi:competence protein ComEA